MRKTSIEKVVNPIVICYEYLYDIDIKDDFFDSLKNDYRGFENWYSKKSQERCKAYVTKYNNGKIGSFLMLKVEDENEDYLRFDEPFKKGKRLKISTFKVSNTGNKIGENYIKIIDNVALKNNVEEIYVTVFKGQKELIKLFLEYGFVQKTVQMTEKANGVFEEELILVKSMN